MPVQAKPLFRPDVLRAHVAAFALPAHVEALRPRLEHWAELLASGRADTFKEQEILPDFLTDFFCELLGYTRPADGGPRYTISREKHVEVDGKFADAVLGDFGTGTDTFIVALEGKGPKDPLDRPFAGRRIYTRMYDLGYTELDVQVSAHHLIFGALAERDRFNWEQKLKAVARQASFVFEKYPGGYEEFAAEFRAFFEDPRRFTYTPMILCRGRKPSVK